jgi:hypothetical protein
MELFTPDQSLFASSTPFIPDPHDLCYNPVSQALNGVAHRMAIVFDTIEEFQAFCQVFSLRQDSYLGASDQTPAPIKSSTQQSRAAVKSSQVKAKKPVPKTVTKRPAKRDSKRPVTRGSSLTSQVQAAIDTLIAAKKAFSAKDVYAEVAATSKGTANKGTVLALTSKMISTQYSALASEEWPGAGPRPTKVFLPKGRS